MDLEQRLRTCLVAPDPGVVFTARVMARLRGGSARRRSSLILIGTVLVVGAAAAMLAWQMSAVQPPTTTANVPIPAVVDLQPAKPDLAMQEVVNTREPENSAPVPAQPGDKSPGFSVMVMPLRQNAQDASLRGPVEALYAATLDELRKIPGLTLSAPGASGRAATGDADFVLTITSLATVASPSGVVARSADGNALVGDGFVVTAQNAGGEISTRIAGSAVPGTTSAATSNSVWVEMRAEPWPPAASRPSIPASVDPPVGTYGTGAMSGAVELVLNNRLTGFNVDMDYGAGAASAGPRTASAQMAQTPVEVLRMQVFAQDAALQQRCERASGRRTAQCLTPAQLAAQQVQVLRLKVFPSDAAFQQRLVAQLGDISADPAEGLEAMRALQDLLQGLMDDGGSRLDAGTIRALVGYVEDQPARPRQYVWNALRGVSHPALIAPLVESLLRDADQQVRLAALSNLESNYSNNPVVRTAFQKIGSNDPDGVVRVAARRALNGQAQWRDEVLAGLQNAAAPYETRLAPLLVNGIEISLRQQESRRAALREQQVLGPLTAVIRENLRNPDHAEATRDVLVLLSGSDDPAVFDLFMQVIRETPALKQEISMRDNGFSASGPVSSWVLRHRDDPRVLQVVSNVDPRLRTMMEQSRNAGSFAAPGIPVSPPLDLTVIPSNLIERMREVTGN